MKWLKYCWSCHVNYDDECFCDLEKLIPVAPNGEGQTCVASRGWNDRALAPDYVGSIPATGALYSAQKSFEESK